MVCAHGHEGLDCFQPCGGASFGISSMGGGAFVVFLIPAEGLRGGGGGGNFFVVEFLYLKPRTIKTIRPGRMVFDLLLLFLLFC